MQESSDKDRYCSDRQFSRILVPKEFDLKIEIEGPDGTRWAARCLDIHISGALLEFAPNNLPDVHGDSKVLVTIQLASEIVAKIPSIVRHVVKRRLGVEFPDLSNQAPEEEDRLSRIVRSIEREVLRKKNQE